MNQLDSYLIRMSNDSDDDNNNNDLQTAVAKHRHVVATFNR